MGRDILSRLPEAGTYSVSGAYSKFPKVARSEILDRIQEAWAAGFDPGPFGGRLRAAVAGGHAAEPEAAVSVAAVVAAEVAGTVWSRDPVNGRRERVLVTANKPETDDAEEYVLDRRTGRELLPAVIRAASRLLPTEDLSVLARAARSLDDDQGRGVELEFCRAKGKLYFLAVRAIPGSGDEPARAAPFSVPPPATATVAPVKPLR